MADPYDFDGLQFYGDGYFVHSDYVLDPRRKPESYESPWELWVATLARARLGDFSWVPGLLDLYLRNDDYVLKAQSVDLLADAAAANTVSEIRRSIATKLDRGGDYDPQFALDMARVLFAQLLPSDVPLLLDVYRSGAQFEDTEIVITYMEYMLGGLELVGGVANLEKDSALVYQRLDEVTEKIGGGHIPVWMGEPFTICEFIKKWQASGEIPEPLTLRRIFEATTGVDCRTFFEDEEFQPLSAAAVLEEFIESGKAEEFELGVRYFFGNRISDSALLSPGG